MSNYLYLSLNTWTLLVEGISNMSNYVCNTSEVKHCMVSCDGGRQFWKIENYYHYDFVGEKEF